MVYRSSTSYTNRPGPGSRFAFIFRVSATIVSVAVSFAVETSTRPLGFLGFYVFKATSGKMSRQNVATFIRVEYYRLVDIASRERAVFRIPHIGMIQ